MTTWDHDLEIQCRVTWLLAAANLVVTGAALHARQWLLAGASGVWTLNVLASLRLLRHHQERRDRWRLIEAALRDGEPR